MRPDLNYMDTLNGLQDAYDQAAEGVTDLNEAGPYPQDHDGEACQGFADSD